MLRSIQATLAVLLLLSLHVPAAERQRTSVIPIKYGINKIDLSGEGHNALAVFAKRENFNAHGFDVLTLYIHAGVMPKDAPEWHIVPVFRGGHDEKLEVTIADHDECVKSDFRLIRGSKGEGARLVFARRASDDSSAVENIVTFEQFVLKRNSEGMIGRPLYYFERTGTSKSKRKYCDVGEALKRELGLSAYMNRDN